jgi:hypothetical protein
MTGLRQLALEVVAALWRGDWSGHVFDGRDGERWLRNIAHGSDDDVRVLVKTLVDLGRRDYDWDQETWTETMEREGVHCGPRP